MLKCFSNMNVLTLSETHLQCEKSDEDPEALYFIPGYSFVNKPRKSGGVAMYISDRLTFNWRFKSRKGRNRVYLAGNETEKVKLVFNWCYLSTTRLLEAFAKRF